MEEDLMIEIMDLADVKFKTKDDLRSDNIHIGVHYHDDGWNAWLERGTKKHVKEFENAYIEDGDIVEVETWFCGAGATLEEALTDLLDDLKEAKMKRGSNNRMVPVIEE